MAVVRLGVEPCRSARVTLVTQTPPEAAAARALHLAETWLEATDGDADWRARKARAAYLHAFADGDPVVTPVLIERTIAIRRLCADVPLEARGDDIDAIDQVCARALREVGAYGWAGRLLGLLERWLL